MRGHLPTCARACECVCLLGREARRGVDVAAQVPGPAGSGTITTSFHWHCRAGWALEGSRLLGQGGPQEAERLHQRETQVRMEGGGYQEPAGLQSAWLAAWGPLLTLQPRRRKTTRKT